MQCTLLTHTYTDAILQKGRTQDEIRALTDMVDRAVSTHPTILLADRGFESYNVFAHVQEKGWHYLIRVKDGGVNGGIGHGLDLPSQDEFDVPIHLLLGLLTKGQIIQAHWAAGNKKDVSQRPFRHRVILLRFMATAERRQ